jgi:hypothetical protein
MTGCVGFCHPNLISVIIKFMQYDCQKVTESLKKLQQMKRDFDTEFQDGAGDASNSSNQKELISLEIASLEGIFVSEREAKWLFHDDFLGSNEVKKAFQDKVEISSVPRIPFSRKELERAEKLGQMLILRLPMTMKEINQKLDGKVSRDGEKFFWISDVATGEVTAWFKDEKFFKEDRARAGWALVSKEVLPDSGGNYPDQIIEIVRYLRDQVFKGKPLPKKYAEAIAEFENFLKANPKFDDKVNSANEDINKPAAALLQSLKIGELTLRSPAEVIYDLAVYSEINKKRLLFEEQTMTPCLSSSGFFVYVGGFNFAGVDARRYTPGSNRDFVKVCFSRTC